MGARRGEHALARFDGRGPTAVFVELVERDARAKPAENATKPETPVQGGDAPQ